MTSCGTVTGNENRARRRAFRHDEMKSDIHRFTTRSQSIQTAMHETEKTLAVTQARKESLQKEIERLGSDTSHKGELGRISSDTDQSRLNKDNREQELNSLLEREVQIGADLTRSEKN